jgi:AraC family transcriptional regulator of adaptative response / DNA-3-methyladenine glycosylase II
MDADSCYRAVRARDARFDGLFFVAVTTTGIYCRPICPARTPARTRCQFFTRAAEAERAGFRACFRCRPELAPGQSPADSLSRLVRAAAARIEAGFLNERTVDELGAELGVSGRHLRRAMEAELGVSPVELAQTRRLALAKQLLQDTTLPLTQVAFAAGFASVRRFNALFRQRFARPPSAVRRAHGPRDAGEFVSLRLDYRPPLDWDALRRFLAERAIPGVESVVDGEYRRTVALDGAAGWLAVSARRDRPALEARVSLSLAPQLTSVVARLRALFDLDARPEMIADHLGRDPLLAPHLKAHCGLRVPGAFDGFEMAVRAILGQQVTVRAATTLSGRLVRAFGETTATGVPALDRLFPSPRTLAALSVGRLQELGMPASRARTLQQLARAVVAGRVDLAPTTVPETAIARWQAVPGIGPWTASYVAMRALGWPDAFPAADLGVRKALGARSAREAEARASDWRPWRAYAVMHLWSSLSQGG